MAVENKMWNIWFEADGTIGCGYKWAIVMFQKVTLFRFKILLRVDIFATRNFCH